MASACVRSGRPENSVELIVITKNHPVDLVLELATLGHGVFGENRDQEAGPKAAAFAELRPGLETDWHFVGQLQTNKVKSVLKYAKTIHSLDRPSLIAELAKVLERTESTVGGFIELNLTGDPGRGGVLPEEMLGLAEQILTVPRINLLGVMAVAGLGVEPAVDFERTLQSLEALKKLAPQASKLSLGMSEDFETAIEFGATHIRVGSAITGPRATNT